VLFIVGIALPISYRHWLTTRTFVPVDMPVSLSRGQFETGEFYINLAEQYFVRLSIDAALVDWEACGTFGFESLVTTRLILFQTGNTVGKIIPLQYRGGNYDSIGYFDAEKSGWYNLKIEVLSEGSCLNKAHPRLSVAAFSGPYHDLHYEELWLSTILVLTALGLWNASCLALTAKRIVRGERFVISENASIRYHGRRGRPPRPEHFVHLRLFGVVYALFASLVLVVLLIPVATCPSSQGIRILIGNERSNLAASPSPSLVLRITKGDAESPISLFLNSKPIPLRSLIVVLLNEFSTRPDWYVYVDASPELEWHEVAEIIDEVRAAHGTVILFPKK